MTDYLNILRPLNIIITAFSALIAYLIAASATDQSGAFNYFNLLLVVFCTSLTAGGGNVINDLFDVEIDRINKPQRPLPSGRMGMREGLLYYSMLVLTALSCSSLLGLHSFFACAVVNIILFFYAAVLKKMPFWGNVTVAGVSGYLFYFCSITTGVAIQIMPLALSAFFFHLIREIIKDAADEAGDRAEGAVTFVIRYGLRKTILLVRLLLSALILFLTGLMVLGPYGVYFYLFILFLIFPVLLYVFASFQESCNSESCEKLSRIMKYDMIFGILAFYFGNMQPF